MGDNAFRDEEIIRSILREGMSHKYSILYKKYYQRVLDKCYTMVKNKEKARELAQEIFAKAFEMLGTFQGRSSFSSWLYSITYNHCIDYLRIQKKISYPDWDRDNVLPDIFEPVEEDFSETDYDMLMKILDKIHPEEKALLLMKYQDGISIHNISTALRISESAAKMRLKRAKARVLYLYREMKPEG
ncbi:MAG: RNA polymerase sigma factor [Bacteroidetes bacterium]|nr:RNA polymerase sigma factor [Bacteroidota bacterium]